MTKPRHHLRVELQTTRSGEQLHTAWRFSSNPIVIIYFVLVSIRDDVITGATM